MRLSVRLHFVALTCVLGIAGSCTAQNATVKAEPAASFGTVTGHVCFQGNNAPARLVNVALQPMEVALPEPFQPGKRPRLDFTIYQTGLDGAYAIPHVRPGVYYVVVNVPGLLSPFAQFTPQELANPSPEVAQRMAATLPVVSVQPNSTATLDLHVQRGASLSGNVRFDDGTPFLNAEVTAQRRDADGHWVSSRMSGRRATADIDGHWQLSGLLPGEYRVRVGLELNDRKQDAVLGENSDYARTRYSLEVYSGDTTRESKAKSFTLEENQQLTGEDITVPVSSLHAVTGAVVDAGTGQPLNAGDVELVYADDGKHAAGSSIDSETRTFTFPFVAEGAYTLRTKNAREARFEQKAIVDDDPMANTHKEITLRQYKPGEIPIVLGGEMTGVTLPVQIQSQRTQ